MTRPVNHPDLNPIENLWLFLTIHEKAQSIKDLLTAIQEIWNRFNIAFSEISD